MSRQTLTMEDIRDLAQLEVVTNRLVDHYSNLGHNPWVTLQKATAQCGREISKMTLYNWANATKRMTLGPYPQLATSIVSLYNLVFAP